MTSTEVGVFRAKIRMTVEQRTCQRWRECEKRRRIRASIRRSARFFRGRGFGTPGRREEPLFARECSPRSNVVARYVYWPWNDYRGWTRSRDSVCLFRRCAFRVAFRVALSVCNWCDEPRSSRESGYTEENVRSRVAKLAIRLGTSDKRELEAKCAYARYSCAGDVIREMKTSSRK